MLLYAHHDVQPAGPDAQWASLPFEATLQDGRLYGRGAADDKAGIATHLGALQALAAFHPDPDLGLVVFIEGEEEIGSPTLAALLDAHAEQLRSDVIVVADADNWSVDVPSLTVSLRGMVNCTLEFSTLEHANHSGLAGGAVPDAMLVAIRLLNTLWDADGTVAVRGLTTCDLKVPSYPSDRLRHDTGLRAGVQELGRGEILSRLWAQPAITVVGMDIPDVAHASNTLLPSVRVRLSVRIAPDQDPDDALAALRAHIEQHVPFGAQWTMTDIAQGAGFRADLTAPFLADMEAAMSEAWGAAPMRVGIGGTIPFIATLAERFPAASVFVTGVEDPGTRAHSPNESLHLGVFRRAIGAETAFLVRLETAPESPERIPTSVRRRLDPFEGLGRMP